MGGRECYTPGQLPSGVVDEVLKFVDFHGESSTITTYPGFPSWKITSSVTENLCRFPLMQNGLRKPKRSSACGFLRPS